MSCLVNLVPQDITRQLVPTEMKLQTEMEVIT